MIWNRLISPLPPRKASAALRRKVVAPDSNMAKDCRNVMASQVQHPSQMESSRTPGMVFMLKWSRAT